MIVDVKEEKNIYLSNFERLEQELGSNGRSFANRLRKTAFARFSELGFPGPRNEDWKFTSVAPLAKMPFKSASRSEKNAIRAEVVDHFTFGVARASRLVFVNGYHVPELSSIQSLPEGVIVSSLSRALAIHGDKVESHLARYASFQEHAFTALNTAFVCDGAFIWIPRGIVVTEPIYLLYLSTARGEGTVSHPRNLVIANENSQITLVETYVGLEERVYFTNAVTEVAAGPNSSIDHYKVQRESSEAFHVATVQVHQGRASRFSSHSVLLGGSLVRNEVRALLDGEGCECILNGLYLASGRQHVDNHTVIDHAKAHCVSHELYKGILKDRAQGVFNGKIFVRQDAQKTDAKQTNQTLLLSDNATINTKPQLEIFADDVKCTHGATVGQLEKEAIFYLRSRGIGSEEARSLLTFAFANDIINRIKVEPIRAELEKILLAEQGLPVMSAFGGET